jgi:hypothetical protein
MSHQTALQSTSHATNEAIREILSAIENLRYGSVEIVVHDGRVTQIEKREKVRFGQEASQQR